MIATQKYGFYGRLTADFPSQVVVDITERCNLACIHCPHELFTASDYYAARDLEVALNHKLVDEVRESGQGKTLYIRYSSEGEPLLHPAACEMISYAARNSGVFVTLTSNGTILDQDKARDLVQSGVHMIDISIDAFKSETYAKIRRKGNLDVTKGNVLRLIDMAKSNGGQTKVVVSFIVQEANASEVVDFESFWKDKGADYVVIRKLHSAAGTIDTIAQVMREHQKTKERRPCLYPWERVVLTPRGYLAFCPADWEHSSSIADFRETSIRTVWNGDFYKKLRQAHLESNFNDCPACLQCPDWEMVTWPEEGRSYAELITKIKSESPR